MFTNILFLFGIAATCIWAFTFWRRWGKRKNILIRHLSYKGPAAPVSDQEVQDAIMGAILKAKKAHGKSIIGSLSVGSKLGVPNPVVENLGTRSAEMMMGFGAPILLQPFILISNALLKIVEIETELIEDGSKFELRASVRFGRNHLGSSIVRIPSLTAKSLHEAAWDLVAKLSTRLFSSPEFDGGSIGTSNWKAFQLHCEALISWASAAASLDNATHEVAKTKFLEALAADSSYAAAHYNLGSFMYRTYESNSQNLEALQQFRCVLTATEEISHDSAFSQRTIQNLEGLAHLGIARCSCQSVHRYGVGLSKHIESARASAARAVELLGRTPDSLYALAFSWHCIETMEDLKKGRDIYEEIIAKYPSQFGVVYTNLGYVMYREAEYRMARDEPSESMSLLLAARTVSSEAVEINDHDQRLRQFSYANLGATERLLKNWEASRIAYEKALGVVPRTDNLDTVAYLEGLNEYSELLIAMGIASIDESPIQLGLTAHGHALKHASSNPQARKFIDRMIRAITHVDSTLGRVLQRKVDEFDSAGHVGLLSEWPQFLSLQLGNGKNSITT